MACSKKQAATINRAFWDIPHIWHGFADGKTNLFLKCIESERRHRRGHRAPRGFSANLAARYFTVKWLREYVKDGVKLTVQDYLHVREECFYAAALALAHSETLKPWADAVDAAFDDLDYAKLMED